MTRGTSRRLDYAFLGAAPPSRWWQILGDHDFVDLQEPGVLALGTGGSLSLLLSGLPSSRRDVVGTRIRHTVVVDGLESGSALATRLAATALDPVGRDRLGGELDRLLPAELVDSVLSGSADGSEIGGSLERLLASPGWAAPPRAPATDRRGSWAAPLDSSEGQAAFLARVSALVAEDRKGHAFVTHTLTSLSGAERAAAELPGDSAILLADGDVSEVVALGKAVAAGPARRVVPPTGRPPLALTAALTATVVFVLILLTILLL